MSTVTADGLQSFVNCLSWNIEPVTGIVLSGADAASTRFCREIDGASGKTNAYAQRVLNAFTREKLEEFRVKIQDYSLKLMMDDDDAASSGAAVDLTRRRHLRLAGKISGNINQISIYYSSVAKRLPEEESGALASKSAAKETILDYHPLAKDPRISSEFKQTQLGTRYLKFENEEVVVRINFHQDGRIRWLIKPCEEDADYIPINTYLCQENSESNIFDCFEAWLEIVMENLQDFDKSTKEHIQFLHDSVLEMGVLILKALGAFRPGPGGEKASIGATVPLPQFYKTHQAKKQTASNHVEDKIAASPQILSTSSSSVQVKPTSSELPSEKPLSQAVSSSRKPAAQAVIRPVLTVEKALKEVNSQRTFFVDGMKNLQEKLREALAVLTTLSQAQYSAYAPLLSLGEDLLQFDCSILVGFNENTPLKAYQKRIDTLYLAGTRFAVAREYLCILNTVHGLEETALGELTQFCIMSGSGWDYKCRVFLEKIHDLWTALSANSTGVMRKKRGGVTLCPRGKEETKRWINGQRSVVLKELLERFESEYSSFILRYEQMLASKLEKVLDSEPCKKNMQTSLRILNQSREIFLERVGKLRRTIEEIKSKLVARNEEETIVFERIFIQMEDLLAIDLSELKAVDVHTNIRDYRKILYRWQLAIYKALVVEEELNYKVKRENEKEVNVPIAYLNLISREERLPYITHIWGDLNKLYMTKLAHAFQDEGKQEICDQYWMYSVDHLKEELVQIRAELMNERRLVNLGIEKRPKEHKKPSSSQARASLRTYAYSAPSAPPWTPSLEKGFWQECDRDNPPPYAAMSVDAVVNSYQVAPRPSAPPMSPTSAARYYQSRAFSDLEESGAYATHTNEYGIFDQGEAALPIAQLVVDSSPYSDDV